MSVSPSSKVCPKCQPHLAATAGAVEQDISREPYFSRKKKSPEHNKRVTFITDYAACGSPTKEVRPCVIDYSAGRKLHIKCCIFP